MSYIWRTAGVAYDSVGFVSQGEAKVWGIVLSQERDARLTWRSRRRWLRNRGL